MVHWLVLGLLLQASSPAPDPSHSVIVEMWWIAAQGAKEGTPVPPDLASAADLKDRLGEASRVLGTAALRVSLQGTDSSPAVLLALSGQGHPRASFQVRLERSEATLTALEVRTPGEGKESTLLCQVERVAMTAKQPVLAGAWDGRLLVARVSPAGDPVPPAPTAPPPPKAAVKRNGWTIVKIAATNDSEQYTVSPIDDGSLEKVFAGLFEGCRLEARESNGATVAVLPADSLAAAFGLRAGDVLLSVNGQPIKDPGALADLGDDNVIRRATALTFGIEHDNKIRALVIRKAAKRD